MFYAHTGPWGLSPANAVLIGFAVVCLLAMLGIHCFYGRRK